MTISQKKLILKAFFQFIDSQKHYSLKLTTIINHFFSNNAKSFVINDTKSFAVNGEKSLIINNAKSLAINNEKLIVKTTRSSTFHNIRENFIINIFNNDNENEKTMKQTSHIISILKNIISQTHNEDILFLRSYTTFSNTLIIRN